MPKLPSLLLALACCPAAAVEADAAKPKPIPYPLDTCIISGDKRIARTR